MEEEMRGMRKSKENKKGKWVEGKEKGDSQRGKERKKGERMSSREIRRGKQREE